MSYVIDAVTLPRNPSRVIKKTAASFKELAVPGNPYIISFGDKAVVMTWEGFIEEAGKDASDLETDYLTPLDGKVHSQVTVACPDSRYDGNWILTEFTYEELGGQVVSFRYRMQFVKGATHIVM